uniref:RING-type domain-containing protein n=1 Tax=Physcomitrium patens TaxID=3218 RepID=A0A7I4D6D7_PHYPA
MEGSGPSEEGSKGNEVEVLGEGSTRWRGSRVLKPCNALAGWSERATPSLEHTSNEVEVEDNGELQHQAADTMDDRETSDARWCRLANPEADVSPWRRRVRIDTMPSVARDATSGMTHDGRSVGSEGSMEVSEMSGWRNPRMNRRHAGNSGPGNGESARNEVVGPSHRSRESPVRRLMQGSASGDAKRARRIMHRSGVTNSEEPSGEGGNFLRVEDVYENSVPSGEQINVVPSPGLRRGRSLTLGPSALGTRLVGPSHTVNNGLRRRLGRHRSQAGGGSIFEASDSNNLRRPFVIPLDTENERVVNQPNGIVNLEDPDSPTLVSVRPGNTIVLDDDGEAERARQLSEDERVARELQEAFALEDMGGSQPPTDEMFARMLQDEENSHGLWLPLEQRPVFFAPPGLLANEHHREARRLFRNELAQGSAGVADNVASGSRVGRRGLRRNSALGRMLNAHSAPTPDHMLDRRIPFPSSMGLESRMEFLAALEMAFQEQLPVGLQLAHLDRDFNENDYEMLLALDTDNSSHRGASMETINQLPVTTIAPTDVFEDCSICLEVPVSGDIVRRLPCMHVFHQPCIDQWLQCQAVCPVCKAHISGG